MKKFKAINEKPKGEPVACVVCGEKSGKYRITLYRVKDGYICHHCKKEINPLELAGVRG